MTGLVHLLTLGLLTADPPQTHHHPAATPAGAERALFQSDMTLMAGMTPRDPMGAMAADGWQTMTMGIGRLVYNHQGGPSGDQAIESTNWTMFMAHRGLARGRLTLMAMSSLEPLTLGEGGSPQLFQAGETFEGRPLVDRQHPHDFFMNLSATYRAPIGGAAAFWVQAAPRGEPALGPTAFMHRASAGDNPAAVLGHHQHDSTHITDDVITMGGGWRWLIVEGSVFHGAEPDEGRWDLDPGALDSVSGRVKLDFGRGWSGQASYGFLNEPEALEPGDTRRTTASLHYGAAGDRPLAASLVWGRNREEHGEFSALLVEGAYQLTRVDHFFARAERVDREAHLLLTKDAGDESAAADVVSIRALTLGYVRDLKAWSDLRFVRDLNAGAGASLTLYAFPDRLTSAYGDSPVSLHAFLRLRWGRPHRH
jgi:hypothetical protein